MEQKSSFDPSIYERIGYDELVNYSIFRLVASERATSFENIVAEAYGLFPERFSLRGYPQWPDSAVVNKSWLRCRTDKKYIVGSVKDGFKLTQRGLQTAEKTEKQLNGGSGATNGAALKLRSELRTRSGRLLRSLEQTPTFNRFASVGDVQGMDEYDLADMLLALPDSPAAKLRSNLEQFRDAARLYERDDILEFLDVVEHRFSKNLGRHRK